ncbi:MAG: class I SAM-dependent methyltransferase [Acidobacteria bacterium]|nr:class I SAM-dependent methyltransferase [Acidobacteriota bacterium]
MPVNRKKVADLPANNSEGVRGESVGGSPAFDGDQEPAEVCHVCGSGLKVRFANLNHHLSSRIFSILGCEDCGLGQTSPRITDVSEFYAEYYGGRHGFTNDFCARRRLRWLERAARGETSGRLLDVGCGDGTFLRAAQERGWQIAGTELDASRFEGSGIDVFSDLGSAHAAFGPESFDAVTMWHSLEHFHDPRRTLAAVDALLKPGGALIVAVPNAEGMQASWSGRNWLHLDVPNHLFHFGPRSLLKLLDQTGFAVEWRRDQEFEYDLLGWSQSALNTLFVEKNVFFRTLTGHAQEIGKLVRARDFVLGTFFAAAALPLLAVSTVSGRGGTLVVCARKAA